MIVCSQPDCQTTAGCKCYERFGVPYPSSLLAANATEIASLRERVKELEAEKAGLFKTYHLSVTSRLEWRSRAETAERKLAKAMEALKPTNIGAVGRLFT